jgi:3-hydroxy-3-methylglutaryl CoA synthase
MHQITCDTPASCIRPASVSPMLQTCSLHVCSQQETCQNVQGFSLCPCNTWVVALRLLEWHALLMQVSAGLWAQCQTGNIYTGSVFLGLARLWESQVNDLD